ncbi:MAG TPA: SgcJ/EcaC family oxidoreductase [Terriglobales bacterium]|nr:SgcJ/EcaC family oxidoreductase [Terriglobales bacterium]
MKAEPKLNQDMTAIIHKTGEEWARYWNSRQPDKLAQLYAEDAVYLPPHHPAVHGRQAIREYLSRPLHRDYTDLMFEVTYIKQTGDLAFDVGTYSMEVPKEGGGQRPDKGKYLTVWRKHSGGDWHIVADSWSSDLPHQ